MRKKFTMLLASLFLCVGAWAQSDQLNASTSETTPEYVYAMKNGNNAWMCSTTAPTQANPGRFAFYAVEGKDDTYQIFSLDQQKWVSYDNANSDKNMKDFVTLADTKDAANAWKITSTNIKGGKTGYQMVPYKADGNATAKYMNWNGGLKAAGGYYEYDHASQTVGLWEDNAATDAGSGWVLVSIQPKAGTVYYLQDLCGTFLDIHNLGKETNDASCDRLATLNSVAQPLYITATAYNKWKIHTTAEGGEYLCQKTGGRGWNSWVAADQQDYAWQVELTVSDGKLYQLLKNTGDTGGYLGGDKPHSNGASLYVGGDNGLEKALKLTLTSKMPVEVVYNFKYEGETKYTQTVNAFVGDEYPAITQALPFGVTATKPTGVIESSVNKDIDLVVNLPFEYASSYDKVEEGKFWYYLKFNTGANYYIYHKAGQNYISLDKRAVDEGAKDVYSWGFVGNPFDGFKVVNRGAGETMILSSSETMTGTTGANTWPIMTEEATLPEGNNTYWTLYTSTHADGGFFMGQKGIESNKLNDRGKLAYWTGGAGTGSTFVAVRREFTNADELLDEANALLEANKTNHAVEPALGQYSTAAYNALAAVCGEENPAQDAIENALREFKKGLNTPVYMIKSAHDGYANGSAIYYDGAWKWNTVSRYNRQMWMTISGHTQVEIPVVDAYDATGTHYEICDYLTGNVMRDKKVQIVKIDGWDGVYNLQYSTTDKDAVMHAKDTKALVGWNPATATDAKAGAWTVEYIGNTYDLDKMTEEKAAALIALEAAVDANTYLVGLDETMFGDGLGKYSGDASVVFVYHQASQGLVESLSTLAGMETSVLNGYLNTINSVTINKPATGKFYRVKSMNANDEEKKGKYWQVKADATAMELNATVDASNSIIYLGEDNTFLSYGAGQFLNNYITPAAVEAEATAWNITKNLKVPGTYALYRSGDSYCLSDWNGAATYGNNDANAAWIFEEVVSLPVAVSAAGYATLYAPVALTIPTEDVTAVYTATVDGTTLNLNPLTGTIPANTGVIIEAAQGTYNFAVVADVDPISGNNALTGKYAKSVKNPVAKVYTLQMPNKDDKNSVGFYLFKGYKDANDQEGTKTYINGFRAWVELPADSNVQALRFTRGDDEDTTGIESVEASEELVIFDLAGRRVEKMEKGIYIVNGKKVVIK